MKRIDFKYFLLLIEGKRLIEDYIIDVSPTDTLFLNEFSDLELRRCVFTGADLIIRGNKQYTPTILSIKTSTFEGLQIYDADIRVLFLDNLSVAYLSIHNSTFVYLSIFGFKEISYTIKLDTVTVKMQTEIFGNEFINLGTLTIANSDLNDCRFIESTFNDVLLQSSTFRGHFDFFKNNLNHNSLHFLFNHCVFEKTNFTRTTFSYNTQFNNCDFLKTSIFHEAYGYPNTTLSFESCYFEKYVQFNYTTLPQLEIDNTKFNEVASFQDTEFDKISIDRTIFEKAALFDNIRVQKISECDIRTLRIIKQQLQKSDNTIDYNRFRSHELAAYNKKLNWKWKEGFKDKFILWTTNYVTGFDHSWRKALWFVVRFAFLFYVLFFISENYMLDIKFSNWKEFISGYFRFLLVTDFYNPLSDGKKYIDNSNTIGWFIFIAGKIVIAFGIYEMIQAFRKFKA